MAGESTQSERSVSYFSESIAKISEFLSGIYDDPNKISLVASNCKSSEISAAPLNGEKIDNLLEELFARFEHNFCNVFSPAYFGYISPRPHPLGVIGDFLALGVNQTPGAWRAGPAATKIELEVLTWFRNLFNIPQPDSEFPGGIFTGGGTIANLIALKLARDAANPDSKLNGISSSCRVYCSNDSHFSIDKSIDFLGIGSRNLVKISVDSQGLVNLEELRLAIESDLEKGYHPIAIIGTVGTTATAAIEPIRELSAIAKEFRCWFHVDAAAGLPYAACAEIRESMKGIELADSITFDPCKWMFMSFGVGCLLVKDGRRLYDSCSAGGGYWEDKEELDLFQQNLYGTRQFRSLGIWMLLRGLGFNGYRKLLLNVLDCTALFQSLINADSRFILLEKNSKLPVICFKTANMGIEKELVEFCQGHNICYPTLLNWNNEYYLRFAFSNYEISPEKVKSIYQEICVAYDRLSSTR
ncbi:pyridoxal phosphate-dependent decarboxylase family protein [Cellvibrio sp. ARAG 10.3]|uniref:pyridoxal phosphate-dependent decarboxylase family protein n=1 Tax=Cellvibrio sp. ARAG 10.3 TaxID=3451358 RepID=UPI003F459697